ncbi:unnamed protein product [Linum trigynum]|uniref:Uncharacterized protein n=1 Tax=Linum trigynum TaxID=586398 RepID=A0AAV2EWG8_9ROSI
MFRSGLRCGWTTGGITTGSSGTASSEARFSTVSGLVADVGESCEDEDNTASWSLCDLDSKYIWGGESMPTWSTSSSATKTSP